MTSGLLGRPSVQIKNANPRPLSLFLHVIWHSPMVAHTLEHSTSTQILFSSEQDRLFKPQVLMLLPETDNASFLSQEEAIEEMELHYF